MLPNDAESPQFPSENFSSLPIIWKVGLSSFGYSDVTNIGGILDDAGELEK